MAHDSATTPGLRQGSFVNQQQASGSAVFLDVSTWRFSWGHLIGAFMGEGLLCTVPLIVLLFQARCVYGILFAMTMTIITTLQLFSVNELDNDCYRGHRSLARCRVYCHNRLPCSWAGIVPCNCIALTAVAPTPRHDSWWAFLAVTTIQ